MVDIFFFFKQKTAYEIGTGDWSSDVCSSDLHPLRLILLRLRARGTSAHRGERGDRRADGGQHRRRHGRRDRKSVV